MIGLIYLLVVLCFAICNAANEEQFAAEDLICKGDLQGQGKKGRLGETQIKEIVENFRKQLREGIPDKGIPPMDPLRVRHYSGDFNSSTIRGFLKLTNLEVKGITDFVLTDGKITTFPMVLHLGFKFDTVLLSTEYTGNLDILEMIDVYGSGSINITLKNFKVALKAYLTNPLLPPFKLSIKDVSLDATLPTTDAKITGLLDDEYMSDLISRQLSDTLSFLAQEEEERINSILYDVVMYLVDEIINPALEKSKGEKENFNINGDYCYPVLTDIKQTIKILTEKDVFVKLFAEKFLNTDNL